MATSAQIAAARRRLAAAAPDLEALDLDAPVEELPPDAGFDINSLPIARDDLTGEPLAYRRPLPPKSPAVAPKAKPLVAGDAVSPEPERPKFGPIPEMPPEQADAVYKFASEQVGPPQRGPESSESAKLEAALELARKEAARNGWMNAAGRSFARAAALMGSTKDVGDMGFHDALDREAERGVRDAEAKQRAAAEKEQRIRDWTLQELGLEEKKADNARADKQLEAQLKEAERRGLREEARDKLDREQFSESARHNRALEAAARETAKGKASDAGAKASTELRKELLGLPATKQFQEVAVAYDKVQRAAAQPSAAGDLSLIFGYMKMLDPGSSVREGEFANAQNAAGIPERIVAQYNRALSGERLTPEVRTDFLKQAKNVYSAHEAQFEGVANQYRGLANRSGAAPDDVVVGFGSKRRRVRGPDGKTGWWDGVSAVPPGVEVIDG